MQLKLYQIVDFPRFYELLKNQKISFKTSYKLTILAKEIETHHNFYSENFANIISEYGERDKDGNLIATEDGNGIKIRTDMTKECHDKFNELRDLIITLPDISFSIEEFANLSISPMEVNTIIPFIKD